MPPPLHFDRGSITVNMQNHPEMIQRMTRLHEAGKSHTGIKVLTGLFLLLNSSIAVAHQGPHESLMQVETQLQQ